MSIHFHVSSESATTPLSRRRYLGGIGSLFGLALAGCLTDDESPAGPQDVTVTVILENRDDVERPFDVQVIRGDVIVSRAQGTLQAGPGTTAETISTGRALGEEHRVTIASDNGQQSYSWEPADCAELTVDAWIRDGEPAFETDCRSG